MIFCKLVLALFLLPEANCPAILGGWGVLCFIFPGDLYLNIWRLWCTLISGAFCFIVFLASVVGGVCFPFVPAYSSFVFYYLV